MGRKHNLCDRRAREKPEGYLPAVKAATILVPELTDA